MATRPGFTVRNNKVRHVDASFEWSGGFAISQKRKNIAKLHEALEKPALEVSTKGTDEFGVRLSAFNLKLGGYPLENVYQSAKTFKDGGPYTDLLNVAPREAKHDERLKNSGSLIGFTFEGNVWPLEPKSLFYDYIYVRAVKECISTQDLAKLNDYEFFTDIEFNPNKSISTQARAIVIVKILLNEYGEIPDLDKHGFMKFYRTIM